MIESQHSCDGCLNSLIEQDIIYCSACVCKLEDEIEELKDRILELEDELSAIKING